MMFEEIVARLKLSSVQIRADRRAGGSGVIWRAGGEIVTNAHVVSGNSATVTLADGREFAASVTSRDAHRDLAMLRIPADNLPAAPIGDSGDLRVGQIVIAIGNPLGITAAVSTGIVHAVSARSDLVQADVRLAPGNSGGMLANTRGQIIGINTMIYSGLALAVSSNAVEEFFAGGVAKPVLGISFREVELSFTGDPRPGLLILDVETGNRAQSAGLMLGDILLHTRAELARLLKRSGTITLKLLRGGQPRECTVDLGADQGALAA